jgi:integrase/recombinase XerD
LDQYKREPLTQDEEARLRAACRKPAEKATVTILLETGIRVSELSECSPHDQVDWQGRRLTIYGKTSEPGRHNTKRRILPLSDEAFETFVRYRYLFETMAHQKKNGGGWISIRTVERLIHRVANRAGIVRPATPHVLRHTFAVNCLRRGIHPRTIQALLGHESFATTQKYLNLAPEDVISEFHHKWDRPARHSYDWMDR